MVPPRTQLNDVEILIENMNSPNLDIIFHQNEFPPLEMQKKNDALMIVAIINRFGIRRTLIDNGLGIDICSVNILDKIGMDITLIQLVDLSIKGFDNVGREPLAVITLLVKVGKVVLQNLIHVMPHDLSYNLLLGRPWIHEMKRVPSMLHHSMKYIYNNKVYMIRFDPKSELFTN